MSITRCETSSVNRIRRVYLYSIIFAIAAILFIRLDVSEAQTREDFFSYERFFLKPGVLEKIPRDGRTQTDIKRFAASFTNGIYAFSGGDLSGAEKDLLKARDIWPEYFGTDFLLALVYEKNGDPRTAARYYKSYLNKLRAFHSGEYRISAPLIRSISSYGIEGYRYAYELVDERLQDEGIRIRTVRPAMNIPEFIMPLLLMAGLAAGFILLKYAFIPYFRKWKRVKNPPEGFWVCRRCGTGNPVLRKECEECGRPRE